MKAQHLKKPARAYEKPRLRIIELVAEEVLAIGCKTVASTNVGREACGFAINCVSLGS
jgi:hypothetical protein